MGNDTLSFCVAGGGSWGTALAHLAASNGHDVTLYLRNAAVCDAINTKHENPAYLSGCPIHPAVRASVNPDVLSAPFVILAIPCQMQRASLTANRERFAKGAVIINVAKGIELSTLRTGSSFIPEILADRDIMYAVLSGPSFAREVMHNRPTAVVIASRYAKVAETVQRALSCTFFRCYASSDVLGVEIGGAVKNIVAIAAGLCDGLGIGSNGRAALVTRGLAEISRLGTAMGALPQTFMGLSGLGDLVLTTTGDLSRNRQVGLGLGQGRSLEQVTKEIGMVTEGVKTSFAVHELALKLHVSVPITDAVCDILNGKLTPSDAALQLMQRHLRSE